MDVVRHMGGLGRQMFFSGHDKVEDKVDLKLGM